MMEQANWYQISNIDQIDSPALIVYTERVKQNINHLLTYVNDVDRLRPHVKTHKSPEATKLLLQAGIYKFKCATIAEAEMLAQCGAPDVLLAYQPVGAKIGRFIDLIRHYAATTFACLVDNVVTARQLAGQAVVAGVAIPVYIDLNVGMNRTGTTPDASVLALYDELAQLEGLRPMGLHAYDGHIRNTDLAARTVECNTAFEAVSQLRDQLRIRGYDPIVIAGGSPTFPIHAQRPDVECSPGTFIYWDNGYQTALPEQPFRPAALVVGRVISRPDATKLCIDIGHKSIAAESDLSRRITFLNAPELRPIGQSEEHLVVEAGEGHTYQIGDVLYGLPHHICPTCALYERAYTAEQGNVSGEWRTVARDRVIIY
ncbi:D-TA family PLP-dependent enzyme [Spirosoma fluminis]